MVKATSDCFAYIGKLNRGLEGLMFRFVKTPSYWKFCEAQDTALPISQEIVDKKIKELKKIAEEGEAFAEDGGTGQPSAKYKLMHCESPSFRQIPLPVVLTTQAVFCL